jgi:hypothetical protein
MWEVVRPDVLFEVNHRVEWWPGLEHGDIQSAFAKNLRGRSTPSSRSDNADVVNLGGTSYLRHEDGLNLGMVVRSCRL